MYDEGKLAGKGHCRTNRDMQEIPTLHDVYTLIQDIETKGLLATGKIIEDIQCIYIVMYGSLWIGSHYRHT